MARVYISCAEQDLDLSARIKDWLRFQDYDPISLQDDSRVETSNIAQWHREYAQTLEHCDLVILILTPEWQSSKWCFAEFTEAFSIGKTIFAVVEKPLEEGFAEPGISIFDLTQEREEGLARLAESLRSALTNTSEGLEFDPERSVYPGLRAFDVRDGFAYFCRSDDIRRVIDRLNTRRRQGGARLLALLGAPGTGISSLMMGGVLPKIQRDQESWIVLPVMRPRFHPIEEFCRSISKLLGNEDLWEQWADLFRGSDFKGIAREMADQLRERFGRPNAHILISIDQAEELYSISNQDDASQFLDVLGAILDDDMPYVGLAALRPDFLEEFQTSDQLSHVVEEFSPRLMPLSSIREIITAPAKLIQLDIEDELVEAILSDALQEGALPLVAVILRHMYDHAGEGHLLTLDEYRNIGNQYAGNTPLGNIIAKVAEEILEQEVPNEAQLLMLEEVFARKLIWRDNDNRYISVPVAIDDINLQTRVYVRHFIDAGLLVPVEVNGVEMVEYAHLSILDHWPRLIEWVRGTDSKEPVASAENFKPAQISASSAGDVQVIEPDEITSPKDFSFQADKDNSGGFIEEAHDYVHGEIIEPQKYENGSGFEESDERFDRAPSIYADQEDRFAKATYSDSHDNSSYAEDVLGQDTDEERDVPDLFTRDKQKNKVDNSQAVVDPKAGYSRDAASYEGGDELYDEKPVRKGKLKYLLAAVLLGGVLAAGLVYWPQIEPHVKKLQEGFNTAEVADANKEDATQQADKAEGGEDQKASSSDETATGTEGENQTPDKEVVKLDPRFIGHEINKDWPFLKVANAFEVLNNRSASQADRKKAQDELSTNLQKMKNSLTLSGHEGPVRHVSFSPKGIFIATASEDKTVKLWDLLTGSNVLTLRGHGEPVNSSVFSPDGRLILTASDDGTAKVWNSQNGELVRTLSDHNQAVKWAVFDSTGERMATASSDNKVYIWQTDDGKLLHTLTGHEAAVNAVTFSKNGNWLATASQDQTARIWDAASGQEILVLRGHKGGVRSVKFTKDGTKVLTGSEDHSLILWHTFSGKRDKTFTGHKDAVVSIDMSPDEDVIISTSLNGNAILWNSKNKSVLLNIKNRSDGMRVAAFSKKGEWIAAASKTDTVHILPAEFYIRNKVFEGHTDRVFSSIFGQDGELILTASRDATARVWNVEKNTQEKLLSGHVGQIHHSAFSPDEETIATAGKDKTVRIWNVKNGREVHLLEGAGGPLNRVAFNPEGTLLVAASQDKSAYLWNVETGDLVHTLTEHEGPVWSVLFSNDGSRIYTASEDKTIKVWDALTGEVLSTYKGHTGSVLALALSEDGKILASGSADKTVRFWDTEANKTTGKVLKHRGFITSIAFNSEGDKLISGSFNRKALIWNRKTGKILWEINEHEDRVMSVDFSEEGNWALTASSDRAFMWRVLSAPEMIFFVKAVLPRCLLEEERKKLDLKGDIPAWCKQVEELRSEH